MNAAAPRRVLPLAALPVCTVPHRTLKLASTGANQRSAAAPPLLCWQDAGSSPDYQPSCVDYLVLRSVSHRRLPYNAGERGVGGHKPRRRAGAARARLCAGGTKGILCVGGHIAAPAWPLPIGCLPTAAFFAPCSAPNTCGGAADCGGSRSLAHQGWWGWGFIEDVLCSAQSL